MIKYNSDEVNLLGLEVIQSQYVELFYKVSLQFFFFVSLFENSILPAELGISSLKLYSEYDLERTYLLALH